uniref:Uncharacterized protein n=1 Tax=Knipowitschia caucasica TaxID=637954 RepID=A0AAV2LCW2_KNICA
MSGDNSTLTWRSMSPTSSQSASSIWSPSQSRSSIRSPSQSELSVSTAKIIKVCFLSNSPNLGKNFKLVKCEEGWTVKQPMCLTAFTEIRSISCFCESEGRALLTVHTEAEQLGQYLVNKQELLSQATLTLFSLQICKALEYLESLSLVHSELQYLQQPQEGAVPRGRSASVSEPPPKAPESLSAHGLFANNKQV